MGTYFSGREFSLVERAENAFHSPIPTQVVSNGEFNPPPQNAQQKLVAARVKELADTYGTKQGLARRQFLKTSSGMAAAFLAMNSVYGNVFNVSEAEAADAAMANERAEALRQKLIFDVQTHFVRDDYTQEGFLGFLRQTATDWNTGMAPDSVDIYLLKFENYVRQIYLNSDTDVTVLSSAPFDDDTWEFLNNAQVAGAAQMVNLAAGHTRMLAHSVVTPGQPGWMEEVDRALAERPPASWKLYTIGDPLSEKTKYPFWLDDEKLMYPFYEKVAKAGIVNLSIHKGLMPRDYKQSWAGVWEYQTPRDLIEAAADWPQLNFIIHNGCFRAFLDKPEDSLGDFERTGRIEWCSELAEVPARNGASNIYAGTGTAFASTSMINPRLTAAMLGTWIKGLGASNVVWGTDSVLYGSPQWQIEAMRRMEIPEDMQEKYGFAPLGGADSAVKQQIFGLNSARLYNLDLRANYGRLSEDKFAQIKRDYDATGELTALRDNTTYRYIAKRA